MKIHCFKVIEFHCYKASTKKSVEFNCQSEHFYCFTSKNHGPSVKFYWWNSKTLLIDSLIYNLIYRRIYKIVKIKNILLADIFWHRFKLTLFHLLLKKRRSKTHNYNCHSKKFPLRQSEKFVCHTRLNLVDHTTQSCSNTR